MAAPDFKTVLKGFTGDSSGTGITVDFDTNVAGDMLIAVILPSQTGETTAANIAAKPVNTTGLARTAPERITASSKAIASSTLLFANTFNR